MIQGRLIIVVGSMRVREGFESAAFCITHAGEEISFERNSLMPYTAHTQSLDTSNPRTLVGNPNQKPPKL